MKIKNNKKYQIYTPNGFQAFNGIRVLKNQTVLILTDKNKIESTWDHPFVINGKTVLASELKKGDLLETSNGHENILSIFQLEEEKDVYDLLNVENGNIYYTNNIVSHNCFIETGETAIDKALIAEFRQDACTPIILNTSEYKVWEKPDPNGIYIIGGDVSDGVGGCASCLQGLNITDLTNIKQAFTYWNRFIDTNHFSKEIDDISKQWGRPYISLERNAMGGEVINNLQKPPFSYERLVSYSSDKTIDYEKGGIFSSTNVKYEGVSNFRYWLNSLRAVRLFDLATIQELENFVKYPNGTWRKAAGSNNFDDRVMALIWALFPLINTICENIFEVVQYDERGKPLKIRKSYYDDDSQFYGLNQYRQDWGDNDFVSAFIVRQTTNFHKDAYNPELDDLLAGGWMPALR